MADFETAAEISKKVSDKEKDLQNLHRRMDGDYDLWSLKPDYSSTSDFLYQKKDVAFNALTNNDVRIVSNEVRDFANRVQSTLSRAAMQIIIRLAEQGDVDRRDDIAKLERLLYFAFYMADMRLRRMALPPLRDSVIWDLDIRGSASTRTLVYEDNGNVVFDISRQDPRWFTYEAGPDGFLWTAYKNFMSGSQLEAEWGYKRAPKDDNEVIDYWRHDGDRNFTNAVIFNKEFVKEPTSHELRSHPSSFVPVSTRPHVVGPAKKQKDIDISGYGDSIFAPLRDLNKTRNRFASITATHANLESKQPIINYYKKGGSTALTSTAYEAGRVINMPADFNKLEEMPVKPISPSVIEILNWLNRQMENVMLPNIPIGTPPPSGTLYNLVQEQGNKILSPQLSALEFLYLDICNKIEEQLVDGGISVDVKLEHKRKYYQIKVDPKDIKENHLTKVEFTASTPWTEMDVYQIADMAKRMGLPQAFINEHILKLPDPKGMDDMAALEVVEHSPEFMMLRGIDALINQGREEEAQRMVQTMFNMVVEEQAGVPPEEPAPTTLPEEEL